jgi:hypothetical protein
LLDRALRGFENPLPRTEEAAEKRLLVLDWGAHWFIF